MSLLSVHNLTMTFIERNLFTDVTFDVEPRDKIGFIGANGVGKTTIFKIISSQLSPTAGNVFISKDAKVGYMEQHACTHPERCVYDELLSVFEHLMQAEREIENLLLKIENNSPDRDKLILQHAQLLEKYQLDGGLTYKNMTKSALLGLGFCEKDFSMPTGKLSGGQRSKLSLAKLLLSKANLLLLDEPTNHLDIKSVEWLEGFIKDFKGAVIIISHDRYFLDAVTDRTIELEHSKVMSYKGNYSVFIEKKEQVQKSIQNQYQKDLKEISRIEGIIEQQKRWGRERNFITAESKQKQVDRIKEQLVIPDSELDTIHFKFSPKNESGNDVLICDGLSKSFGEKHLFANCDMHIRKGERVFIIGENGCGKTTLFKILTDKLASDSGSIRKGVNVDIGYFDQMQADLDLSKTALDLVWDRFPFMTQTEVRTALGSFLFKGDEVFKQLSSMSGGERARIALLCLMLRGDNFLLLDEPTNHLDTASREQLEKTLSDYDGTLLIVSHDRYFINKLATRLLELTPKGMNEYLGNYDYYLEKSKSEQTVEVKKALENKPKVNEYKLKKEQQSRERKRKTLLKNTEDEIESLENEILRLQQALQSDEVTSNYEKLMELSQKLEDMQNSLEEKYELWESLQIDEE